METVGTREELRARVAAWRAQGECVALVPTMGNLHAGHLALVRRASELAERTVASVFVNPTQFGPSEDFAAYPRTLEADAAKLAGAGLDLLFAPPVEVVYPFGTANLTRVSVPGLSDILCGAARPGHFDGVATVVAKLFNLVQPDLAVFGEKDYQQLLVIRRMAAELDFPVQVLGVPTVREADGLAMSSRNAYLSADERKTAPALYRTLRETAAGLSYGKRDYGNLEAEGKAKLARLGFRPDYLVIRRAADLALPGPDDRRLVILAAAWLGKARLIDNLPLSLKDGD